MSANTPTLGLDHHFGTGWRAWAVAAAAAATLAGTFTAGRATAPDASVQPRPVVVSVAQTPASVDGVRIRPGTHRGPVKVGSAERASMDLRTPGS